MGKSFFDYFGLFWTMIGTVLGIISIILALNSEVPLEQVLNYITTTFIITTAIFLFLFFVTLYKYLWHKRYSKAYKQLNLAFSRCHGLLDYEDRLADTKETVRTLESFCTDVAKAFSLITGRKCSVCIKLIYKTSTNDAAAITFCRDTESANSSERVSPEEDENEHILYLNSDFWYIFENVDKEGERYKYYFCNNLPFADGYRNTRFDKYGYTIQSKGFPFYREIKKYFKWPLPYKSVVTVPITPLSDKKLTESKIAGYLSIDSKSVGTFSKKYDIPIARGIADGIYPTIKRYNSIKQ